MRSLPHLRGWPLIAVCLLIPALSVAQEVLTLPSPLTVEEAASLARQRRAEILAARARATAVENRPAQVAAPPDPMIMLSADHIPFMGHGADASAQYQQDFPLSRVLGHRRRAAEATAAGARAEVSRARLDVELDAARAFFMLDERRRTSTVLDEQLVLTAKLVAATIARFSSGRGAQGDVLQAQSTQARLRAERQALEAEIRGAEAMLRAALALPQETLIPPLASTPVQSPPLPASALAQAALGRRPELSTMRAEQQRARADVDVMRSMYFPMGFVRTGPAYTMADGAGVMFMFGLSLPVWRGRLRAGVAEAQAMVQMADSDVQAMSVMIAGEAAAARESVAAAQARLGAIQREVLPLSRQGAQSQLAGYAAGQVPLASSLLAFTTLLDARMDEVMAQVSLGLAWARLRRAMGVSANVEGNQ
jgi:cobalt-zinc-cadmium efflux system outer membrane protein